ncbi:hypothetical protein MRX96_051860 [Rhipicephalus microplus]
MSSVSSVSSVDSSASTPVASQKDGGDDGSGGDKSDNADIIAGGGSSAPTATTTPKDVHKTTQELRYSKLKAALRSGYERIVATTCADPHPTQGPPQPTVGSQNDTLLCVSGTNPNTPENKPVFPDDGLCDLTFYAHLSFIFGEFSGTDNGWSWENFKDVASRSSKPMYGFSINYR